MTTGKDGSGVSAASEKGFLVTIDGYDCLLQKSDDVLLIYKLTVAPRIWVLAAGLAVVLGILGGVWGGLIAGILTWAGWYKVHLPRLARHRLADGAGADDRIVIACIEYAKPDGARAIDMEIRKRPQAERRPKESETGNVPNPILKDLFGPPPSEEISQQDAVELKQPERARRVRIEFLTRADRESLERVTGRNPRPL